MTLRFKKKKKLVLYQLQVGIGALAGSTIMLLTIPWSLVVIAGRVDIDPKTAELKYKPPKLTPPDRLNLYYTGVSVQLAAKRQRHWYW